MGVLYQFVAYRFKLTTPNLGMQCEEIRTGANLSSSTEMRNRELEKPVDNRSLHTVRIMPIKANFG